ncbi:MAG: polysaccharide deacetylase family protein [Pyrinomonadaceae bacterium]|nr:polysaccharide deacetylase family protein [Pyrinomonadaceae bacterium]
MFASKLLLKRSLKSLVALANGFRRSKSDSLTILAYHRVAADINEAERDSIRGLVISAESFRKHCLLLKENFQVVNFENAMISSKRETAKSRPLAVITFDDGYLDNYEKAFPILNELDLPATIFLPSNLIGKNEILAHDKLFWLTKTAVETKRTGEIEAALREINVEDANNIAAIRDVLKLTDKLVFLPFASREKLISVLEKRLNVTKYPSHYGLMNWEMVREMSRNGITFGGHTANHPVLTLENDAVLHSEIVESKGVLEHHTNSQIGVFAYPNGKHNENVLRHVKNAGYQIAVTTKRTINRFGDNPLTLGRISLCEESTRGISGEFAQNIAVLRLNAVRTNKTSQIVENKEILKKVGF